jgi:hypothetical protein
LDRNVYFVMTIIEIRVFRSGKFAENLCAGGPIPPVSRPARIYPPARLAALCTSTISVDDGALLIMAWEKNCEGGSRARLGPDGVSDQSVSDFPAVSDFVVHELLELGWGISCYYLALHWLAASEAELCVHSSLCPLPSGFPMRRALKRQAAVRYHAAIPAADAIRHA